MSGNRGAAIATIVGVTCLAVLLGLAAGSPRTIRANGRMKGLPQYMLWAWERPEDLRFLDPSKVGVAFLAQTVFLRGGAVKVRPRLQPLQVPSGTTLIAVVRIESAPDSDGSYRHTPLQGRQVAARIADVSNLQDVIAVQVDFDAVESERDFYAELLREVSHSLPERMPLSITALASWCIGDSWLTGLPVDEAVPMLFRMGPDRREVLRRVKNGEDFRSDACRQSVGISTDEPIGRLPRARRIYLFHPRAWTIESARKVLGEVGP